MLNCTKAPTVGEKKEDRAVGRSRGGWTTKLHFVVDRKGKPIKFLLSGGNVNDPDMAIPLLQQVEIKGQYINGDKGYDSKAICDYITHLVTLPIVACVFGKCYPQ